MGSEPSRRVRARRRRGPVRAARPRPRSRRGSARRCFAAACSCPAPRRVQPATLARGLRRVAARARGRRSTRGRRRSRSTASGRGCARRPSVPGRGGRRTARGPARRSGRSASGPDRRQATARCCRRRRRRAERVGRGVAVVRTPARDMVVVHRPDRADPGPSRRPRLDRRRGPRRRAVHAALPAHDARRPDRASAVAAVGPASAAASARSSPTTLDRRATRGCGPAAAVPVAARRPHRGRLGRADRHHAPTTCRGSATVPGRPIHYGHGYSGNGVGAVARGAGGSSAALAPSSGGRSGAGAAAGDWRPPRAFPPEPARYLGCAAGPRGDRPARGGRGAWRAPVAVLRELSRLPRRIGLPPRAGLRRPARRVRAARSSGNRAEPSRIATPADTVPRCPRPSQESP